MSTLFAMFGLGHMELLIVAAIILLLFGHRLPSMMRSLGRGVTEFKEGLKDTGEDGDDEALEEPKKSKAKIEE